MVKGGLQSEAIHESKAVVLIQFLCTGLLNMLLHFAENGCKIPQHYT